MDNRTNMLSETVNVTMHTVSFNEKEISYAKVQRNTAYIGNIIDTILKSNKVLDRETLLYAAGLIRNGIIELLKSGKAVDLLETGILYIKPDGSIDSENPSINDIPEMKLSFTPSEIALDAVKDVVVAADVTESNEPQICSLFDISARSEGNDLSEGCSIRIRGKKLKVAGDENTTGVFLALCDENGKYSDDRSTWAHIAPSELVDNTSSVLLFNLPRSAKSGMYRLIVRTAYGAGSRINKTVRTGLFPDIIRIKTA